MLIEWISELINNINQHGIRFGLIFAFYAIYRKERRNYRLDQRDILHNAYFAAILANQRKIMDKLGVEGEWVGKLTISAKTDHRSLKQLSIGYYTVSLKKIFQYLRRKTKMPNINKAMLGPIISTLLLIIKTSTGYDIPLPWADMMVDFILSVYTIYGFFLHPTGEPIIGRINKALIMPIFAMVFLIISLFTHHPVANDLVSSLADFVVYALTLWGQFMHPVTLPQATAPNSKNFIQG